MVDAVLTQAESEVIDGDVQKLGCAFFPSPWQSKFLWPSNSADLENVSLFVMVVVIQILPFTKVPVLAND